jgi:thiamine biosynthesis lipoprotein
MTEMGVGRDTFDVFGTTATLLVTDPRGAAQARAIADRELAAIDLACSRFRPDSELTKLNSAPSGRPQRISQLFTDLLAAALRAARLTGGDVDPTCGRALAGIGYDRDFAEVRAGDDTAARPATPVWAVGPVPGWRKVHLDRAARRVWLDRGVQLDLGATAKAWASDRCAELIAAKLDCGVLISLGGDIAVAGPAPEEGWPIRVTDDHAAPATAPGQTVTITSGGLATSSTTVRAWKVGGQPVHHIIDPSTGEPARSCWRTVSVAAGSCTDANTASTAAIVRGAAAPGWLHDVGLPARLVRLDGSVETTPGWPQDGGPGAAA